MTTSKIAQSRSVFCLLPNSQWEETAWGFKASKMWREMNYKYQLNFYVGRDRYSQPNCKLFHPDQYALMEVHFLVDGNLADLHKYLGQVLMPQELAYLGIVPGLMQPLIHHKAAYQVCGLVRFLIRLESELSLSKGEVEMQAEFRHNQLVEAIAHLPGMEEEMHQAVTARVRDQGRIDWIDKSMRRLNNYLLEGWEGE